MKFTQLTAFNFMGVGGDSLRVALSDAGLVGVFGANGAGKSTIIEALTWCCWGETLRGLKGDDVVNAQEGQDCAVGVFLEEGGQHYQIQRTRRMEGQKRPNDLILLVRSNLIKEDTWQDISAGVMTDTQQLVDNILGMSFSTFTQSVLMTDKTQSFCSLTDAKQKELLEDILQIGVLSKARKVVKERLDSARATLQQQEIAHRYTQEANAKAIAATAEMNARAHEFEATRESRVDAIRASMVEKEALLQKSSGAREQYEAAKQEQDDLTINVAEQTKQSQALLKDIQAVKANTEKHRNQIRLKLNEVSILDGQLRKNCNAVGKLAGTVCTNCKQLVDTEMAQQQLKEWNAQLSDLVDKNTQLNDLMDMLDSAEKEDTDPLFTDMEETEYHLSNNRARLHELTTETRNLQARISNLILLEADIKTLGATEDTILGEENPYLGMSERFGNEVYRTAELGTTQLWEIENGKEQLKYLEFWDTGYSNAGVKSFLFDSILPFLNRQAQKYADILSGGTLRVNFNTQTANKSGEVKDKFSVEVVNTKGSEAYKGNSSGERARADIAISWALADLAGTRAQKPVQFRALDEPFEHLDEEGVEGVFKLLKHAQEEHGTILCITHNEALQDRFNKVWTVDKHRGFTRIKC